MAPNLPLHSLVCTALTLAWGCSSSTPQTATSSPAPSHSPSQDAGRETTSGLRDAGSPAGDDAAAASSDAGVSTGSGSIAVYVPPDAGPKPWFERIEPPDSQQGIEAVDSIHTQLERVSDTADSAIASVALSSSTTQRAGQVLVHWTPETGSVEIPLPEQLGGLDSSWVHAEALAVAPNARKAVVRLTGHGTIHWFIWSDDDGSQLLTPGEDVYDLAVDLFSTNNEAFAGSLRLDDDRVLPFYALGTSVFRVSLSSHATHTDASAISHNASVIAGNTTIDTQARVYRWELNRGVSILELPEGFSDCWLSGNAMSASGSVLAFTCSNEEERSAFRWTRDGGVERLDTPTDADALPAAVSTDGTTIVGELRDTDGGHVFVHRGDASTTITPADSSISHPLWTHQSVSADGSMVLGQAQDQEMHARGFFWSVERGPVALLPLRGHSDTWVSALADDGRTVAGYSSRVLGGGIQAIPVIWRAGDEPLSVQSALEGAGLGFGELTFSGTAQVTRAGSHVWGTATTPGGQRRAWIAHLP